MLDWFDCASCGCTRPGREEEKGKVSAEMYEKWAKSAAQRSHRDVTQVSKISIPLGTPRTASPDVEVDADSKMDYPIAETRASSEGAVIPEPNPNEAIEAQRTMSAPPGRSTKTGNSHFGLSFWKKSGNKDQWKTWKSSQEIATQGKGTSEPRTGSGPAEVVSLDRKSWKNKQHGSFSFSFASFGSKKKVSQHHPDPELEAGKKKKEYFGDEAVMLYTYTAGSDTPFPPDPRRELTAMQGQKLDILDMRPDGWCLVRKPTGTKEYWLPGNYLSEDGVNPYYVPGMPIS